MRWAVCLIAVILVGCGDSPTSPSPTPRPIPAPTPSPLPAPSGVTVTGTITSTTTSQPIGSFSQTVASLPAQVTVSAGGYVTRQTWITNVTPSVDLFPESGLDMAFFRQLARDDYDRSRGVPGHTVLQPLWVLTEAPSFYMEVEGARGLSKAVAARLEAVARRVVPAMTGGRFQVGRWETGPSPRAPQNGWIVIERKDDIGGPDVKPPLVVCGRAAVGAIAGQIWLHGDQVCRIEAVFAHELGHALGFFHTSRSGAMMYPTDDWSRSAADAPLDIERHHAALAYARPRFNTDIDVDPRPSSTAGFIAPRLILD